MDQAIQQLRERVADLAAADRGKREPPVLPGPAGEPIPAAGTAHELFPGPSEERSGRDPALYRGHEGHAGASVPRGTPPLALMAHWLAGHLEREPGLVLWIGRGVWPYPRSLDGSEAGRRLLERSLLVDASGAGDRLWAAELALRSAAVAGIALDGREMDMTATRRLQLASGQSGALLLIARRAEEAAGRSACAVRWLVEPLAPEEAGAEEEGLSRALWKVRLLRCKGLRPELAHDTWALEWSRAGCSVRAHAAAAGGSRGEEEEESRVGGRGSRRVADARAGSPGHREERRRSA